MNLSRKLTTTLLFIALATVTTSARADVLGAHAPLFLNQAEQAVGAGDTARAIELVAPRLQRLHTAAERKRGFAVLCQAYLARDDFQAADQACERASAMSEADWSDINNRGVLNYRTGDFAAALAHFERAQGMNPESKTVRRNVAAARAALTDS